MSTSYQRAPHVLWRRSGDQVLLLPCGGDEEAAVTSLRGTGVVLWDLLDQGATVEELASTLADAFGVAPEVVSVDIQPVLDDLVQRTLITASPG